MLKEFKEFAVKGNLVDIAVAFVMGVAFNKVVASFTGGIVSPLIGMLFKADFKHLKYIIESGTISDTGEKAGEVAILYGDFLTNIIDFVIVAFVMFMIIKAINNLKRPEPPVAQAPLAGPSQEELLAEIRDLLKK
jgi:large conductance mechanosensitive channel